MLSLSPFSYLFVRRGITGASFLAPSVFLFFCHFPIRLYYSALVGLMPNVREGTFGTSRCSFGGSTLQL